LLCVSMDEIYENAHKLLNDYDTNYMD